MYIVGFNGPPESGKDTLAEMVADHLDRAGTTIPVLLRSLSTPLRSIAYGMAGWDGKRLDGPDYTAFKSTMFPLLGVTGRQLMIDASEKFLKPTYGEDIMARLLLSELSGPCRVKQKLVLLRDSGFQCEVGPLIEAVGESNALIVQVRRPGKTFDGDSREWIKHPNLQHTHVAENYRGLAELQDEAKLIVAIMIERLRWSL